MKKLMNLLKSKYSLINIANVLAIATLISSVNSTCNFVHYQPEVPEEVKKFRKF